jgi:hypothetical protein
MIGEAAKQAALPFASVPCRICGAEVVVERNDLGQWVTLTASDRTAHWASCKPRPRLESER